MRNPEIVLTHSLEILSKQLQISLQGRDEIGGYNIQALKDAIKILKRCLFLSRVKYRFRKILNVEESNKLFLNERKRFSYSDEK